MKAMFTKKRIIILTFVVCVLSACSYNEQPPKTDDASTNYVIPAGEVPTDEEYAYVQALRDAYDEEVGN